MDEQLKTRLIEASELEQRGDLYPLLLFKGGQSVGRIRALLNFSVQMMERNQTSLAEVVKLSVNEPDFRHTVGLHAPVVNMGMRSFYSRLLLKPETTAKIPGLLDFVRESFYQSRYSPFQLGEISQYSMRTRRAWRQMPEHLRQRVRRGAAVRKEPARPLLASWPYSRDKQAEGFDLVAAVDSVVPKYLPPDMRADVCQDMLVAILSGDASLDSLAGNRCKYVAAFFKMFPTKYGHLSLDQPAYRDSELTLADAINMEERAFA